MNYTFPSKCRLCGEPFTKSPHYCKELGHAPGAQPLKQLTEADVRRIVREELNKKEAS